MNAAGVAGLATGIASGGLMAGAMKRWDDGNHDIDPGMAVLIPSIALGGAVTAGAMLLHGPSGSAAARIVGGAAVGLMAGPMLGMSGYDAGQAFGLIPG